jgi:xanthine dehydrogenase molybdopterin-binding subunit B
VDFTAETMADLLTGEYEVDRETALKDSTALLEKWTELGFVE